MAETFKLEDDDNQLSCHITHTERCLVLPCDFTNNTFTVAGDKHLFIMILQLGVEGNKTNDLILNRTATKPTKEELEYKSEMKYEMIIIAILRISVMLYSNSFNLTFNI